MTGARMAAVQITASTTRLMQAQTVVEKPPPDGLPVIFSSNVPIRFFLFIFILFMLTPVKYLPPVCQSY